MLEVLKQVKEKYFCRSDREYRREISDRKRIPNKQNEKITFVRDSIVKNLTVCDISFHGVTWPKSVSIVVRPKNVINHIKPVVAKKPDVLIVHTGNNDFQDSISTIKKLKKIVAAIKEVNKDNSIQTGFFGIVNREDHNFKEKTDDVNSSLYKYCSSLGIAFIDN